MTGTNAYAVLGEQSPRRAKVLDLGFGGVALEVENNQSLPDTSSRFFTSRYSPLSASI